MDPERTVHVIDDDRAVRRSLECLLHAAGFEAIAHESAIDFLDKAAEASPGCLVVDVRMPGMDGLELQDRLNRLGFRVPVIVMTGHADVPAAVQAMKAGAVDFIEKPCDDQRLLAAVEQALAVSEWVARDRERAEAAERIAALSPRERQVLDGLQAGRANKMIAHDLGLSVRTVEVHRARMLARLGVRSLAPAVRLAVLAAFPQPTQRPAPITLGRGLECRGLSVGEETRCQCDDRYIAGSAAERIDTGQTACCAAIGRRRSGR